MKPPQTSSARTAGWMGIRRGYRARPLELLAEWFIFGVSFSAMVLVFLIFVFVTREALPVVFGQVNNAVRQPVIPVEQMDNLPHGQLGKYLGLDARQLAQMDRETLKELMAVRVEAAQKVPDDKDSGINTLAWRQMFLPHQWTGYERPSYIWQPVSDIPKFNIIPLLVGSLKTTLVALMLAVPLALAASLYVSQLASNRLREWLKPAVELLAGIPSVVAGFFALIVMASFLKSVFGYESRLNAFVAGVALALAVVPVVFSIAEDALTGVPRSYTQAALALGSTRWQAAWKVVLPAALPGVFAAVILGFGRAVGETMIVLMASGNASIMSWSLFDSTRTVTATVAAELAETVFGGNHYRVLFLIGALLLVATFITNLAGELIIHRLKKRLEGLA